MLATSVELMQAVIDGQAAGITSRGIKAAKPKPLPIHLPPLGELHRIAAKVGSFVALCDQLQASLTTTATTRFTLIAEAIVPVGVAKIEAVE